MGDTNVQSARMTSVQNVTSLCMMLFIVVPGAVGEVMCSELE